MMPIENVTTRRSDNEFRVISIGTKMDIDNDDDNDNDNDDDDGDKDEEERCRLKGYLTI